MWTLKQSDRFCPPFHFVASSVAHLEIHCSLQKYLKHIEPMSGLSSYITHLECDGKATQDKKIEVVLYFRLIFPL